MKETNKEELYIEPTVEVSGEVVSPMAAGDEKAVTVVVCGFCCC